MPDSIRKNVGCVDELGVGRGVFHKTPQVGKALRHTALVFHSSVQECARLRSALKDHFALVEVHDVDELHRELGKRAPDLVLIELVLPQRKGMALIEHVRGAAPTAEILVVSPVDAPAYAVAAVKAGAFGFLSKRDDAEAILTAAHEAVESVALRGQQQAPPAIPLPCAHNGSLRNIQATLPSLAQSGQHVLLAGELGTGRMALARALHNQSACPGVLRLVDCRQLQQESVYALFRAVAQPAGETVAEREPLHNTICLNNLEFLSKAEVKNLVQICSGPVMVRLSDSSMLVPVRYRIIGICTLQSSPTDDDANAARPEVLEQLLAEPLDAALLELPALRHRLEDLPLLVAEQSERWGRKYGVAPKQFSPAALEVLSTYAWPGNLHELGNLVERLTLTTHHIVVEAADIPLEIHINSWRRGLSYREAMEQLEREFLLRVLARTGGCRRRAAERLQLSYSTLKFRLRKLSIGDREEAATEVEPPRRARAAR
jgi:DNA-binding NtrC family response regulator